MLAWQAEKRAERQGPNTKRGHLPGDQTGGLETGNEGWEEDSG